MAERVFPRAIGCGMLVELMCAGEPQRRLDRLVGTSIADEENLPTSPRVALPPACLQRSIARAFALRTVVTVAGFQIVDGLLEHAVQSLLLIECRYHHAHEAFARVNLARFFFGDRSLARHLFQRGQAVVPAWQLLWSRYRAVGQDGDELFFRRPRRSWGGR